MCYLRRGILCVSGMHVVLEGVHKVAPGQKLGSCIKAEDGLLQQHVLELRQGLDHAFSQLR